MHAPPKISVITPSFNQAAFLEATLKSVLDQDYPQTEMVVMDGGSSDRSPEILRAYGNRLAHWASEKDRGQSHAFNKGLAKTTGEIVGWLNSDDLYLGHCLFEAADYFAANPDIDIVFSDYIFIDEHGRYLKRRREPPFDFETYLWTEDCYHANCAGFFRKRVFDRLGGLDETLHFGMDFEFYLRAAKAGFRFGQVRSFWGAYRLHQASKSISAHDRQLGDARTIMARYRPASTGPARASALKCLFSARRLAAKACLALDRRSHPPLPSP